MPRVLVSNRKAAVGRVPVSGRYLIPTQQNILKSSQDFMNSNWQKNAGAIVNGDTQIAPDGTLTADTLVGIASGYLQQNVGNVNAKTPNTFSLWMKSASPYTVTLELGDSGTGSPNILQNFAVTNVWTQFILTWTAATLPSNSIACLIISPGIGKDIYLWQAQFVRANWAGPYTPTTGSIINTGNLRNLVANT